MNPFEMKSKFLEALQRLFGETGQAPIRRQKHGKTKSYAPREQKPRKARSARPRKPAPNGRVELVAKQKKGRSAQ